MDNKIKYALNKAYDQLIPEDMYERIERNIHASHERTMILPMKKTYSKRIARYVLSAAAALVFIVAGAFGGMYYSNNIMVDSIIDIDVNPSVEITANRQDRVLQTIANNDEAKKVLGDMDLENTDIEIAVNAIIGSMVKNGYLTAENQGEILVTVQNNNSSKADTVKSKIVTNIKDTLKTEKVEAQVINQTVKKNDDAKTFAQNNNISIGKATFILNLCKKDASLKAEELAKMSIAEISEIVKQNKTDISDIIDYDYDDSTLENIADEIEDTNEDVYEEQIVSQAVNTSQPQNKISKAEAKAAALKHAGVAEANANFIKVELDRDDGIIKYEVDFKAGGYEYDYEINAENGNVIKHEKEYDDDYVASNPQAESKPQESNNISKAKAKSLALKDAGVKESNTKYIKVQLDYDDGRKYYDVEFKVGNVEYSYEIGYESGKIIDKDIDRDDDDDDDYYQTESKTADKISRSKAKSIALKDAGVKEADAYGLSIEYDNDDGRKVYEVEFKSDGYEYSYTLDAESGKILEKEKERDD